MCQVSNDTFAKDLLNKMCTKKTDYFSNQPNFDFDIRLWTSPQHEERQRQQGSGICKRLGKLPEKRSTIHY